ncbi:MAG: cysteine peptidase family C39 domain-containing protein [Isosphaeraceae bacterium]
MAASTTVMACMLVLAGSQPPDAGRHGELRCGAYCLYAALGSLGVEVGGVREIETRMGQPTPIGYSMEQLAEAASSFGVFTLGVETSLDDLERRQRPFACIASVGGDHYVCVYDVSKTDVFVVDPPHDRVMDRGAFVALWDGRALLLSNRPMSPLPSRRWVAWLVVALGGGGVCATIVLILLRRRRWE